MHESTQSNEALTSQVLTPEQEQHIAGVFDSVFQAQVEDPKRMVLNIIDAAQHELISIGVNIVTPRHIAVLCRIFCERFIATLQKLQDEDGHLNTPRAQAFQKSMSSYYFRPMTPDFQDGRIDGMTDVASGLATIDAIKLSGKLSSIPTNYSQISLRFSAYVAEKLSESSEAELNTLAEQIRTLPESERIDLSQYLNTISRMASMVPAQSTRIVRSVSSLLGRLSVRTGSAYESIAFGDTQERLFAEQNSAANNHLYPRLFETDDETCKQESCRLSRQVRLSKVPDLSESLQQISCDSIGLLQPSGSIDSLGMCDQSALPEPAIFSAAILDNIVDKLRTHKTLTEDDFRIIQFGILHWVDLQDSGTLDQIWQRVFSGVPSSTLQKFRDAIQDQSNMMSAGSKKLQQLDDTATKEITSHQRRCADFVYAQIASLRSDPIFASVHQQIDEFETAYEHGAMLLTFRLAVEIQHKASEAMQVSDTRYKELGDIAMALQNSQPADVQRAIQLNIELQEEYSLLFEMSQMAIQTDEGIQQYLAQYHVQRQEIINSETPQRNTIQAAKREFVEYSNPENSANQSFEFGKDLDIGDENTADRLVEELEKISDEYLQGLQDVAMLPPVDLLRSATIYPFGSNEAEEEIARFKLLHRPAVRRKIEEKLGFSLSEMTLKSQFHLLRFLHEKSLDDFSKIAEVLPDDPKERANIFTTFFACAEDTANGNKILELAGKQGSAEVFSLYSQMVQDADEGLPRMQALVEATEKQNAFDSEDVRKKLLTAPNKFLSRICRLTQDQPDVSGVVEQERSKYRDADDQVQFVKNLLKVMAGNKRKALEELGGLDALLEHLGDMKLQEISATNLANNAPLFAEITDAIREKFSDESATKFAQNFPKQNATMFTLMAGKKLLSFFSIDNMGENVHEIDWLTTPSGSPIQGLAQPALASMLRRERAGKMLYADAKPYIPSSFGTCIEDGHMVAFGTTEKDEQPKYRYLRLRSTTDDENYLGHKLSDDEQNDLMTKCTEPGITPATIRGADVALVRVDYELGRDADSNVDASSPDGTMFARATEIFGDNKSVCTRVWKRPGNAQSTTKGASYVYVIEPCTLKRDDYERCLRSVGNAHGGRTLKAAVAE